MKESSAVQTQITNQDVDQQQLLLFLEKQQLKASIKEGLALGKRHHKKYQSSQNTVAFVTRQKAVPDEGTNTKMEIDYKLSQRESIR